MTKTYNQLDANTDTFGGWLQRTNDISSDLTNIVLTSAHVAQPSEVAGGYTTGNTHLEGTFSANTICVPEVLRGGTATAPAALAISSNVEFNGESVDLSGSTDLQSDGNITFGGLTKTLTIRNRDVSIIGDTWAANTDLVSFNADTFTVSADTLTLNANTVFSGDKEVYFNSNNTIFSTNTSISVLGDMTFGSAAGLTIPAGTTAERPADGVGRIRYNNTTSQYEAFGDAGWEEFMMGDVDDFLKTDNNLNDVANTAQTRINLKLNAEVQGKNANYVANVNDRSKFIRYITASTLTLPSAAACGNGWYIDVKADNGTVTIMTDGVDSFQTPENITLYTGESTRLITNGVNAWFTVHDVNTAAFAANTHSHTITDLPEATAAEYRNNTPDKLLSTDQVWSSANFVALSDTSNIDFNLGSGFNFTLTLAGNRTLINPYNAKVGQTGTILVKQDATGNRTLSFGSYYKFPSGVAPTLSSHSNAVDVISYIVISPTFIALFPIIDIRG